MLSFVTRLLPSLITVTVRLNVHRDHTRSIRDGGQRGDRVGGGGGGGGDRHLSLARPSAPTRKDRHSITTTATDVKVGTTPVQSNESV